MQLRGKTALITGSATRVGKALALRAAQAGCNLVIHYGASADAAQQTVTEISQLGVSCCSISADLSDSEQVTTLIPRAADVAGTIDILINSASVFPAEQFLDASIDNWQQCMSINLHAPHLLSQAFARQLPEHRHGKILNLLDASSLRPQNHHFSYTISKYALQGHTLACAHALAARNIQVNGIALGAILPNSNDNDPQAFNRLAARNPSQRNGSPDDVCDAMMYLLQSDYVTGEIIRIDGGQHLT